MKTLVNTLSIVFLVFLSSCIEREGMGYFDKKFASKFTVLSDIKNNEQSAIMDKFGVRCIAFGNSSAFSGRRCVISLDFMSYNRASYEEAKYIHILLKEHFLHILNNDAKLRPFLEKYPLEDNDLNFSIAYLQNHTLNRKDGHITRTSEYNNDIIYNVEYAFAKNYSFSENYQEEKNRVLSSPLTYSLRYHQNIGFEEELDKFIENFLEDFEKTNTAKCTSIGGFLVDDIKELGFKFTMNKNLSLDEAIELMLKTQKKLIDKINTNETLKPFVKNYPLTYKNVPLIIECKDISVETLEEAIYKISSIDGKLEVHHTYRYNDPKGRYLSGSLHTKTLFSDLIDEKLEQQYVNKTRI